MFTSCNNELYSADNLPGGYLSDVPDGHIVRSRRTAAVIGFDIPVGQQNVFPFQNQIHQRGEFFSIPASGIQIVK